MSEHAFHLIAQTVEFSQLSHILSGYFLHLWQLFHPLPLSFFPLPLFIWPHLASCPADAVERRLLGKLKLFEAQGLCACVYVCVCVCVCVCEKERERVHGCPWLCALNWERTWMMARVSVMNVTVWCVTALSVCACVCVCVCVCVRKPAYSLTLSSSKVTKKICFPQYFI